MSESVAIVESHPSADQAVPDEPFDNADIKTFRSEDAEAGTNICKMLVAFFFYSALAMLKTLSVTIHLRRAAAFVSSRSSRSSSL